MPSPEKLDIHNRKQQFHTAINRLECDTNMITENKDFLLRFVRDCRLGKTIKNREKKSIGVARCLKYIQILIIFLKDIEFTNI